MALYLDVLYAPTTITSRQWSRNTSSTASQNRQLHQNGGHQLATGKTVPKRRSIVTKDGSHLQSLRGYHADSSPEPSAPPAARQRLQQHLQLQTPPAPSHLNQFASKPTWYLHLRSPTFAENFVTISLQEHLIHCFTKSPTSSKWRSSASNKQNCT